MNGLWGCDNLLTSNGSDRAKRASESKRIQSAAEYYLPKKLAWSYYRMMTERFAEEHNATVLHRPEKYGFASVDELLRITTSTFKLVGNTSHVQLDGRKIDKFLDSLELSRAKRDRAFNRVHFLKFAAVLGYKNNLELFQSLSPTIQFQITRHCKLVPASTLHILLTMIEKTGVDLPNIFTSENRDVGEWIQQLATATANSPNLEQIDSTSMSIDFVKTAILSADSDHKSYVQDLTNEGSGYEDVYTRTNIIALFRTYYGERVVLDLIQNYGVMHRPFDYIEMMEILEDWKNDPVYPIEWIMATR